MGLSIDLESSPGIAIGKARGRLTLEQIKTSAAEMWRRVEGPKVRVLWDLREAEFQLTRDEVRELAEFIKQGSPSARLRTAFVVTRDLEFGLVRMFEVFREAPTAQTAVFRDAETASDWLRNEPD